MGRARAWSRSKMKQFLPNLRHNLINYLQNVWSSMSLSFLVSEKKKLPISRKSVYPLYVSVRWQAHLRDSKTPKPMTLTIQNQASSKKLVQMSQKLKRQGVLSVNNIPSSHKSAKIAIFSCQKRRVPNKIET